jgi:hypothetical protein
MLKVTALAVRDEISVEMEMGIIPYLSYNIK